MKKFIAAVALVVSTSGVANAQTNEQVWGTLIGGGLGYVFGDGSGNQKEIAAASAVGGLILGTHASRARVRRVEYIESAQVYQEYDGSYQSVGGVCSRNVPRAYARNPGARNAWIDGCEDRLQEQQYELEEQAYEAGIR